MKKFYIMMLALALAAAVAVPAFAGDFAIKGGYVLDAESRDNDGTESAWYDDDLDVDVDVTMGAVKFHWDIEVADDYFNGHGNTIAGLVDGYYVQWAVNDALTFKAGEWGLGFGRAIGVDNRGGDNLGVMYAMDAADVHLFIGVISEETASATAATPVSGDDLDNQDMQLNVAVKEAGPLTKLFLTYINNVDDAADTGQTFMGIDLAAPIGPVAFALEYGSQGGDQEGGYYLIELGLDELVGFDLNLDYFASDPEFNAYFGEDYDQTYLMSDTSDITYIRLSASYPVNDDLTVGAKFVASVEDDAGNDLGTAMDIYANYKLADNVSTSFTYGSTSEGDAAAGSSDLGDKTGMRARIAFSF